MFKRVLTVALLAAFAMSTLSACGVKGDLTFPTGQDKQQNVLKMKKPAGKKGNWVK